MLRTHVAAESSALTHIIAQYTIYYTARHMPLLAADYYLFDAVIAASQPAGVII